MTKRRGREASEALLTQARIPQSARSGPACRRSLHRHPALQLVEEHRCTYSGISHTSVPVAAARPPPAVSAWLGHSSVRTNQEIYSHMISGQDEEAARKWDEYQRRHRPAGRSRRASIIQIDEVYYREIPCCAGSKRRSFRAGQKGAF